MSMFAGSGYDAYDAHDGGGGSYSFIEPPRQSFVPMPVSMAIPPTQMPSQPQVQSQVQPMMATQPAQQQPMYPPSTLSDAERQQLLFQFQERMQMQQQQDSVGWFDRCWQRRKDVVKMVMMSLVVLFALACHATVLHYVKAYLEDTTLTPTREFFARLSYPVVVLLVLWALKAAQAPSSSGARAAASASSA